MGDVVNLRTARKRKARLMREKDAEARRLSHGRGKAEKEAEALQRDKALSFLDGHRRDKPQAGD